MNSYNQEINRENFRRSDMERNVLYPAMLTTLSSLSLRRIDITSDDRNNHECLDITADKHYLIGYCGNWKLTKAKRNFLIGGWEFYIGWGYIPLRSIDIIFEIENMPTYQYKPAGRLPYDVKDRLEDQFNFNDEE
jgi:hypothetical protein